MKTKLLFFAALLLASFGFNEIKALDFTATAPSGQLLSYSVLSESDVSVSKPDGGDVEGSLVIPSTVTYNGTTYTVTSIGGFAFSGCTGLTSVTIPNSVTEIGEAAFSECTGLTSVTIPNSVTEIGGYAFRNCTGLTSVTIPNSVTSIGMWAFAGCTGLTSVTIPNSVTSIGNAAFLKCTGLTSVTIPNSVTSIGNAAFAGCTGLTSVTIPNSVTSIGDEAFRGCTGLTSVTIPNSVTSIEWEAFAVCTGLTSIIVSSANTRYDSRNNCNAIIETSTNTLIAGCKSTTIPNSVTSIGDGAFYGCMGLTSVTIPNTITSIGNSAFSGCTSLTSMVVSSGNTRYDSRDNCNAIIETSSNTLIAGCKSTTIPNSVTAIGDYAFEFCLELTSVTIPNSITSIGRDAFCGCEGLTSVTIPNSVTSIGKWAFAYCTGLTSVTIPNAVTSIGRNAFGYCTGLTTITFLSTQPPTIGEAFLGVSNDAIVLVPCEGVDSYRNALQHYFSSNNITCDDNGGNSSGGSLKVTSPAIMNDISIRTLNNKIVVSGAESLPVALFDMQGRQLASQQSRNSQPLTFDVPATGVYMIRVGNLPAQRIAVLR